MDLQAVVGVGRSDSLWLNPPCVCRLADPLGESHASRVVRPYVLHHTPGGLSVGRRRMATQLGECRTEWERFGRKALSMASGLQREGGGWA